MNPQEIFTANLAVLDRVIAGVCRRAGLRGADAEDFASTAKLALMENDYAILRKYEGRSSIGTFLTVVVQRVLSRERMRLWGRWRPSAEAERLGPASVLLEKLLTRDDRPLEAAIPIVCAAYPALDRAAVRALAAALPARVPRLRMVPLPDEEHGDVPAADRADHRVHEAEARRVSQRAARVVRETIERLELQDRMLLRFRFGADLSIADAARLIGIPQRPLYRRIEELLRQLRRALEREGIDAALVSEVISGAAAEGADFGLRNTSEVPAAMEERG